MKIKMKNRYMMAIILLAAQLGVAAEKKESNADSEFITLFDGKDLSQWTTETGDWRVEKGVIELKNKGDYQMENSSYLWTKEIFGDFLLVLDFKISDEPLYGIERFDGKGREGNSGVFIRVADKSDPVQTGIEIQVGPLKPGDELARGSVGGIFDLVPPSKDLYKPGEWNQYRITCKGSMITVRLNGEVTAKANLDKWTTARQNPDGSPNKFRRPLKDFARAGYIGLQDHGTPASFRKIRIKRL